jgi:hypothetical protein
VTTRDRRGQRGRRHLRAGDQVSAVALVVRAVLHRHISTGPSSSLGAVAGGAVFVAGLEGEAAAQLIAAIALATGLLFLLLALLKMGGSPASCRRR